MKWLEVTHKYGEKHLIPLAAITTVVKEDTRCDLYVKGLKLYMRHYQPDNKYQEDLEIEVLPVSETYEEITFLIRGATKDVSSST